MKPLNLVIAFIGIAAVSAVIFGQTRPAQTQPAQSQPAQAPPAPTQPAQIPAAQTPIPAAAKGPLSMIFGPVGDVGKMDVGAPKAPMTDTIYLDRPPEEWPPDEFIANPDTEFDWHDLKGWHYAPVLKSMTIIGNRKVKPGDTILYEAIIECPTGTQQSAPMTVYGPHGRRTTLGVRMTPVSPGSSVHRGTLTIPKWAEPGLYWTVDITPVSETRHSKGYYVEHHPALQNLEFEVAPSMDADVMPPELHWVKMNSLESPIDQIRTQPVQEAIPVFAKVTDNKSGVNTVTVRIQKPGTNRFIESRLSRILGQPDIFGSLLTIPQWWEGGDYIATTVWASDAAGQEAFALHTTHPSLKNSKIVLTQDPARIDNKPPTFFSISVDKPTARLGDPITVTAIIADDKAGVGSVAIGFAPHPSYIDRVRLHLKPQPRPDVIQKPGLDANPNIWTGTLETTAWMEPGEWRIDRIMVRDNADNFVDMLPEYFPSISDIKINFTGGNNLREQMIQMKKSGMITVAPASTMPGATAAPAPTAPGKIRRIDMIPPHPPRGACLNCHEGK